MGRTQRKRSRRSHSCSDCNWNRQNSAYLSPLYAYLSHHGWCNDTKLTVRCFPATGRGLCSKRDLCTGDELLKLPLKVLITIATLEADVDFKANFDTNLFRKEMRISFQCLLAFYLLHHKHLSTQSALQPFINSMPTSFATPYFCTNKELQGLPEVVLEKIVAQNHDIRKSFQKLRTVFRNVKDFDEIYTIENFRRSYFCVNSRCVYINSHHQLSSKIGSESDFFSPLLNNAPNLALAPLLDLFNHSAEVETAADLQRPKCSDQQKQQQHDFEYVLSLKYAATPIQQRYKQLFINYGSFSNLRLLIEYGFILQHNKNDCFDITLLDVEKLIKAEKSYDAKFFHRNKFKFIREHNLNENMFLHLGEVGASHNLRIVLHLIFKESNHYTNVLNRVAFGDISQFESGVDDVLHLLVDFKMNEYRNYILAFEKFTVLSNSGAIVLQYLRESVRYLEEYKNTINYKYKNE